MATVILKLWWILPVILGTAIVCGNPDPGAIEAPPEDCVVADVHIPAGEKRVVHGCLECECAGPKDYYCYTVQCPVAVCVDAVKNPGSCCFECPNGINCYGPKGSLLRGDETVSYENEEETCQCEQEEFFNNGEYEPALAKCIPWPVTTVPTVPPPGTEEDTEADGVPDEPEPQFSEI